MDARSRLVQAFNDFGGRVSSEQILKFIKDDELLSRETRYSVKKLIASIAVVEYASDKKRYLVLKDLARDKENLACNMCQSTQTITSQSSENQNVPKSAILSPQESQSAKSPVAHKTPPSSPQLTPTTTITTPATSVNVAAVRPSVYSTFTSNETRLWWMAVIDCRVADMKRLLGINPKLANWADPVNGTALHYAAKFGNINCMKLLINQYHANVNIRSRGRTPLHVAVVHSQRVTIRALVEDFKADPTLMDFSGYFPYMLLENNLKTEYEPFLTHGRLQRIRTALKVFKASNVSNDSSSITKDSSNKKGVVLMDHSMVDFKRPVMLPVVSRRLENFKRPTIQQQQQNHLNRTSTLKPINQNSEHSLRRPSVFEGILKSAAEAAQHWNNNNNNNCNNDHTSSVKLSSESNEEQTNNGNANVSKPLNACSSSSSTTTTESTTTTTTTTTITNPHTRLVQRLDSMISLRREQNALSNLTNSNHSSEIGSSFDLSTSLDYNDYFSTMNYQHRKANTLDRRFPLPMGSHNLKNPSQSTDPYTLKLLLSLLPPVPSTSTSSSLSSSVYLKNVNSFDDSKPKKLTSLSSFHKHFNKKLHRSLSNSSTGTSFKTIRIFSKHCSYDDSNQDILHEFHSLPNRYHSSNIEIEKVINDVYHSKSLSTTALLAETDLRQLLTMKVSNVIKRKASNVSQHSNQSQVK
ncbi:unnamed protein product [Schistosoma rodhaini]|nr:unnamed protein product [Schistosoma rodhaini]